MAGDRLSMVELAGAVHLGVPLALEHLAPAAYRRILVAAPESDWRTDEDEVGIVVVGEGLAHLHRAPVRLPSRGSGGLGARRSVDVAGAWAGRVVLVMRSPFSDARGWGAECFALGCDPRTGAWVAYRHEDGRLSVAGALPDEVAEHDLPRLCYGDAIVWIEDGVARCVVDGTPYHLDDWEQTDAVRAAIARRQKARERLPGRPTPLGDAAARALAADLEPLWPEAPFAAQDRWLRGPPGWVGVLRDPGGERAAVVWWSGPSWGS